ncbi:hypothetical protein [Campylobacter aviculae]|uniref:Uncharacterized protein n=1 Tax=Campylobacter aviculae TaxID=2510190 RepID=A0A4U7BKR2_9BACT|nr:hypothetical protein [Campylobacter aviculae]TKX32573.1 hypothetical protein CQA76_02840 [Campylobacter aviculae]
MFDYAKYENASEKQLIHALTLKEKKAEKLALETKENQEALEFLKKKLEKIMDEPTEETRKALKESNLKGPFKDFASLKQYLMD